MAADSYKDHLYALILAGGGGTRLWPRSRNKTPKQFLKLFKGKTLIQITANRLSKLLPWDRIFIVTVSNEYKHTTEKLLPRIPKENILVEPARKNTAPAHGLGATYIFKKDPNAVIINAASDHLIKPTSSYLENSSYAARYAFESGMLVSLGIKPTYPNTGYGHIKRGVSLQKNGRTIYKVAKFVEKPPLNTAIKYTKSNKYYWNANQYVWRADSFLSELAKHEPKVGKAMDSIAQAIGSPDERETIEKRYKSLPNTTTSGKDLSVDYAVSERTKNFAVLPVTYNWTDIGDWNEVWKNLPHDELGNVIIDGDEPGGEIINFDTSDALIHKDGRLIALLDVDNIIVVDTKDALLIASKSRAQNVKKIVEDLKAKKRIDLL